MRQPNSNDYVFDNPKGGRIVFYKDEHSPFTYNIFLELPEGGGDAAGIKFIRECIDTMFCDTDALILDGLIKDDNLPSKLIASVCQWEPKPEKDDHFEGYTYRYITISKWIKKRGKAGLEKAEARRPIK